MNYWMDVHKLRKRMHGMWNDMKSVEQNGRGRPPGYRFLLVECVGGRVVQLKILLTPKTDTHNP